MEPMPGSDQTVALLKGVLVIGGSGTLGLLIAFLFEYVPYLKARLQRLSFEGRRLVVFALCFALPLLAAAGLVLLRSAANVPDTWTAALMAGGACVTTSQVVHAYIRQPEVKPPALP